MLARKTPVQNEVTAHVVAKLVALRYDQDVARDRMHEAWPGRSGPNGVNKRCQEPSGWILGEGGLRIEPSVH